MSNGGLAVDSAGNAYVSGVVDGGTYPFTTAPPDNAGYEYGFVTKLDAMGAAILWSVPAGGKIALDVSGAVYVAGSVSTFNPSFSGSATPITPPHALSWVPSQCLPNRITANSEAYVLKLDAESGTTLDAQWIDGSDLGAGPLVLAGGKVWITGTTPLADVPVTSNAAAPPKLITSLLTGSFLSAVDFTVAGTGPKIGCVLDGGNLTHVGPVAPNQLITLFGTGLGPATGVNAPDGFDASIDGVVVTFDGTPAQILYAGAGQINVLTPIGIMPGIATVMQVSVNGVAGAARKLSVTAANPNLFAHPGPQVAGCAFGQGFTPVATNADGTTNSCENPAKLETVVSFYVHGLGVSACLCFDVTLGTIPAAIANVVAVNGYVTRVDVMLPDSLSGADVGLDKLGGFYVNVRLNGALVGPMTPPVDGYIGSVGSVGLTIWVTP